MRITLFVLGIALFTTGVAFVYWPAALICSGLFLAFTAVRMGETAQTAPRKKSHVVSSPDFNQN